MVVILVYLDVEAGDVVARLNVGRPWPPVLKA